MTIHIILKQLYVHFAISDKGEQNKYSIEQISTIDSRLGELLQIVKACGDTYNFIYSDFEMRHKIKDIWEYQCKLSKNSLENALNDVKNYCNMQGIPLTDTE